MKIKALLSKTTENGATEAEAMAALAKANELMLQYYIDENDLKDPFIGEKCDFQRVKRIKSAYDINLFLGELGRLFDCFHFYNKHYVTFFGFEDDAKLCAFLYELIAKAALFEAEIYKKTSEYKQLARRYHGKTLVASFVKGFTYRVGLKIRELYENRKSTIPQGMGLVLASKINRVESEFKAQQIKTSKVGANLRVERSAFETGQQKGQEFQITQGIESQRQSNQFALSF